ncbi:MAG: ABC transporter ATP-binding protein [Gammaproteobacteria bacterium]|nr:ABC transporter ATP-binding protein [Gammaproteobacteria bacterium]
MKEKPLSDPTLRGSEISVDFLGLRALENVSIELHVGEILGLIGPNGSGKTTLVNVLCGQIPPSSGRTFCNGEEITALPPRKIARRGIARSFQIPRVFSNLSVEENIEMAAVAHGESRAAGRRMADALLEEFSLSKYAQDLAGNLSYGDKRRVEIARALAGHPRFLLLDEPAAGMNEQESQALLELLKGLPKDRQLGLLIIDHDMPLIMRLCHRLHVLASGKTIAEGDVETVRNAPQVIEAYLGTHYEQEEPA